MPPVRLGAARGPILVEWAVVPKMKTHSGAKKRFKRTASGKIRGRRAYSSHILEKKSPKRKRRMARPVEIKKADKPRVEKLLGGGR